MPDQYDSEQIEVIVDGTRIEQVMSVDTPDESYDREYTDTLGDDSNVMQQDTHPELEGELAVAPTSGHVPMLNEKLRSGEQFPIAIRFPDDDQRTTETYTGGALTEGSDDTFEGDEVTRSYTWIADQIA